MDELGKRRGISIFNNNQMQTTDSSELFTKNKIKSQGLTLQFPNRKGTKILTIKFKIISILQDRPKSSC